MKLTVYRTPLALAEASATLLCDAMEKKPDSLCCFAAGFTQNDTYAAMVQQIRYRGISTDKIRVIGLDEWQGLNGSDEGSCRFYLNERVLGPLGIAPLYYFDGKGDLEAQCAAADQLLDAQGPIDILVLGVGMNGHLGFNEPGSSGDMRSHVHALDAVTQQVGGKYFGGNAPPAAGVTLGLKDLLQAKTILLQIVGSHKAPVLQQLIDSPVTADFPVSFLKNTAAYVYVDKAVIGNNHQYCT